MLPKENYCTLHFMQQLLQQVKIMQFQRDTPQNAKVPNWPELAVHKVWEHATRLPGVRPRLPDEWTGGRRTDKGFFWSTVIGQHPEWVQHLVNDCTRQRQERAAARELPPQQINLPHEVAQMLMQHEFQIRRK